MKVADGEENKLRAAANMSSEGLAAQPARISQLAQGGTASGGSGGSSSPELWREDAEHGCKTEKTAAQGYSSGALGAVCCPPRAGLTHPWSPGWAQTRARLRCPSSTHGLPLHSPGQSCVFTAAGERCSSWETPVPCQGQKKNPEENRIMKLQSSLAAFGLHLSRLEGVSDGRPSLGRN